MIKDIFRRLVCIFCSFCRLNLLLLIAFLNGIHHICFNKLEIMNIQLAMRPQQTELDKISYIDKLYSDNIMLGKGIQEPDPNAFDSTAFREDSEFEGDIDDEDWDDEDEDGQNNGEQGNGK